MQTKFLHESENVNSRGISENEKFKWNFRKSKILYGFSKILDAHLGFLGGFSKKKTVTQHI